MVFPSLSPCNVQLGLRPTSLHHLTLPISLHVALALSTLGSLTATVLGPLFQPAATEVVAHTEEDERQQRA
jgi:hypothetical protein